MKTHERNGRRELRPPASARLGSILRGLTLCGLLSWLAQAVAEDLIVGWAKKALVSALVVFGQCCPTNR